ncbi:hypothetical protein ACHAXR_010058 [Thalassiosira sp. AJA248-18]
MSPNSQHIDSYQHCSEHETLKLNIEDDDSETGAGIGVNNRHRRNSDEEQAYNENNSFSLFELVKQRTKSRATLLLLLGTVILSLGIGWFASDWFSSKHRSHHSKEQVDASAEYIDDHATPVGSIPDLIWSDEFEGDAVDLTKWSFVNGNGCDVGLCGWGNNELEWYTPSNAHVNNGKLIIETRKFITAGSPPTYTSAKIISRGKADFGVVETNVDKSSGNTLERSRRFESRLKLPWGVGIWPAFWMLPTDNTFGGWPKSGEIDIMENIGKEGPNTVHGTVHYGLDWPQHQYSESGITMSMPKTSSPSYNRSFGNLNETFHTYAVERLPGLIRWYIDDIEYSSITKADIEPSYRWTFDEDFYFIFNLAVGGNWPGNPLEQDGLDGDATVFPQVLEVDYVRVYEGIFPRIAGKSVVDCSEENVVYEVVNIDAKDISYNWVVPQNATIKEGQGTSRIVVNFDFNTMESNIIHNEVVHVQANGIKDQTMLSSMGLAKLQENGIGIRVKIVDFDGKCTPTSKMRTELGGYNFDCGRPSTCTQYVLHRTTDEFTCGERIEWLMNEMGMDEKEACWKVGYEQFHGHCGPCNPLLE